MLSSSFRESNKSHKNDEDERPYPQGYPTAPVTPKMLIRALKRLKNTSFKGLIFTPKEVTHEIQRLYPAVEQDWQALFLEVSDKLSCAAAADLVGMKQDLGYYVFDLAHRETDSKSELIFWILYKRILRRRAEEMRREKEDTVPLFTPRKNVAQKKIVKLMPYTEAQLNIIPFIHYRNKMINNS